MLTGIVTATFIVGAHADELHLVGGDSLSGEIVARDEERVVLQHAVLGRLEISATQILATPDDAAGKPAGIVDDGVSPAALQDAEPPEWKSHFEFGTGASFGNTDRQTFHVGARSFRETEWHRTALDAHYYYSASNGDRDENRVTAGVLHDWLLPESPWLYFADGRYDFDEFQDWDYRLAGHGGIGYQLYDTDDFDLTLRAGLGALKEFNSANDNIKLEALAGFDLRWKISDKQQFEAGATIYPDLDDTGEFRTLSYVGWAMTIDDETNTAITARFVHEYQSLTTNEKNDYRLTAGLQFDF